MSKSSPAARKRVPFLAALRHRPRLIGSVALAVVVYFAIAPIDFRLATRLLIAWNAGAWTFFALVAHMMAQGHARPDAATEDEGRLALLTLSVIAAVAAIAAILWELGPLKSMEGFRKGAHLALVVGTVFSAWTFIHLMFSLHYAGAYFTPARGREGIAGGFAFPGDKPPGWSEFVYEGFVIGCAFATADVDVVDAAMRRTVLAHGVIAFVFNTVILALTINIAAGFV